MGVYCSIHGGTHENYILTSIINTAIYMSVFYIHDNLLTKGRQENLPSFYFNF